MAADVPSKDRALGVVQLLALGVNGIVGVGIFFAPSEVAAVAPGVWGLWVYAIVAGMLLPVAMVYATLGGRFQANGGPYVWAEEAFGPGVAFLIGWLTYISAIFSASAVVSGLAEHAGGALGLVGERQTQAFALLVVALLTSVVLSGLRPTARVWTALTVLKLLPLVALLVLFARFDHKALPAALPAPEVSSLMRAALIVVFAMQGFEVVPVLARETRHAERAVPLATLACLLCAACLYLLLHWACAALLPRLALSARPLVDTAEALGGSGGRELLGFGTNLSALGIAFGMFAVTPHYLAVLGREPGLAWAGLAREGGPPRRAMLITAALISALVLASGLAQLLVLSSVAVMSQYAVCGLSLARLAWRGRRGLGWRDAWPAPFALGAIGLLLAGAEFAELVVAGGVLLSGAILFVVARRARG